MGHNDPTDVDLIVDGKIVREKGGPPVLADWQREMPSSFIMGPGGEAYGHNTAARANTCTFSIRVKRSSPDLGDLDDLVRTQKRVAVKSAIVRNQTAYEVGTIMEMGCERGILKGGSAAMGENEAGDVVFTVDGIGPIFERKKAV